MNSCHQYVATTLTPQDGSQPLPSGIKAATIAIFSEITAQIKSMCNKLTAFNST
ncbi:MAG: hypothetical protein MJZ51_00175 [Bacteroidales bacterium]|nr:hypothetical protein [Bacteroidales bacterium]